MQRRNADGPQAPEKMFNITKHQENANQNHNEISLRAHQNGCCQRALLQHSSTVSGNVNVTTTVGNSVKVPQKSRMGLSHELAAPLLDI